MYSPSLQALAITWVGANWGPVTLRAAVMGLFFSFVSSIPGCHTAG